MSVESLKSLFDVAAVILLFLTFLAGAGVLITGNIINALQAERLRQFDKDLTEAKTELGKQQVRAANAERSALEAKQTAESFEKDIAVADQKAAEATQKAEAERLARVQLEEAMAWRRLSAKQQGKIADDLKGFQVARTWIIYNLNDIEAFGFGADLASALSKWNPTEPEPIMKMAEGPVPVGKNQPPSRGVFVSTTGEKSYEIAADALVKALRLLGFDSARSSVPAIREQHPTSTIFISVEPRPEGPQGDAKLKGNLVR